MSDLCNEINKLGKGIGNEARYRIVQTLTKGSKTVSELVKAVKMSQPAVSQHLKTLKECSLVMDERRGQEVIYSLNADYVLNLLRNFTKDVARKNK